MLDVVEETAWLKDGLVEVIINGAVDNAGIMGGDMKDVKAREVHDDLVVGMMEQYVDKNADVNTGIGGISDGVGFFRATV